MIVDVEVGESEAGGEGELQLQHSTWDEHLLVHHRALNGRKVSDIWEERDHSSTSHRARCPEGVDRMMRNVRVVQ
eukprot:1253146-Pyramimonas_sp.AAC.1